MNVPHTERHDMVIFRLNIFSNFRYAQNYHRGRKMKTITYIVSTFVCFLLLFQEELNAHRQIPESSVQRYEIGDRVHNFTLPSATGDSISLYDYEGDVILIHIWNSG